MQQSSFTGLVCLLLSLTVLSTARIHGEDPPPGQPGSASEPFDFTKVEAHQRARWPAQKAWDWHRKSGPIVGCNYLPRSAVNMTEMWQKETFDPETIDQELGWARKVGYNSIRVFIQFLVWKDDPTGLRQRVDQFLAIADRHGLGVMLVPFCDCGFSGRDPYLGKQDEPKPGVANGGWVASPGLTRVTDGKAWPDLEKYIKDLVGHFGHDRRVLIWDLYNEPGQSGLGEKSMPLVAASFRWAREMNPDQPLTIGVWTHFTNRMSMAQFALSDVISFHTYLKPDEVDWQIKHCEQFKRPMICTEWLMRQHGNTFASILPLFARHQVGSYHWGLVTGRTQTYLHWSSKPGDPMPAVWQHDMYRADGTLYDPKEIELLGSYHDELQQRGLRTTDPTIRRSTYRGWKGYELQNGLARLHIVPDIGGRVIQFTLGDKEFFWVNPNLGGRTSRETGLDSEGKWLNYGGDKLWPAPQGWDNDEQWPGPPGAVPDGQPYRAEVDLDPAGIRLTSRDDPETGIRFSRHIRLHPGSTKVSVEATMINIDSKPRRWGIWAHTQLDAGLPGSDDYNPLMRAWIPINPQSRFEHGYNVILGEKDNPSFAVDAGRGLMKAVFSYKVGKIGMDSHAGWLATVDGRKGDVFVQRFEFEPDKDYPDDSSVEIWHNGLGRIYAFNKWIDMSTDRAENPYVFESELLSPYAQLKPGDRYTWSYDWYACRIGGDFPVVGCTEAGVVSEPLAARREGGRTRLRGRFGVFHQGRLVLEAYDEKARFLMSKVLRTDANPLQAIILNDEVEVPAATHRVVVAMQSSEGIRLGDVAQVSVRNQ